jgi:hypothetical protein
MFNEQQKAEALAFLKKHFAGRQCQVCGDERWVCRDKFLAMVISPPHSGGVHGRLFVEVSCENCGYAMLFDHSKTGVEYANAERRAAAPVPHG